LEIVDISACGRPILDLTTDLEVSFFDLEKKFLRNFSDFRAKFEFVMWVMIHFKVDTATICSDIAFFTLYMVVVKSS
jgi:hypothetical protein